MPRTNKLDTATDDKKTTQMVVLSVVLVISVLVLLLADTWLSEWAEASALNHIFQHLLIFAAGVGVGGSGIKLRHLSSVG